MARVLAIHAHPDDIEILAGGTMAALAKAGHHLTFVTMTPGDCGSATLPPGEIAAVRRAEAAASAAILGARYLCAEFRDCAIFNTDESRRRVVEVLRSVRPDLIVTSSPTDYMADHEHTSTLVLDACFAAPARNYSTGAANPSKPIPAIPHLYFMDPISGVDREDKPVRAAFYVDVTSFMETKRQMLAAHASQREWLLKHHGIDDYIVQMERWTIAAGIKAGVAYAEGFRRYLGHPYPQTPLLEELAGPMFREPVSG